ncbi:hypothetical protein ON010_g784 [Phytophthora cinnamomi]|nr:hypothetical protein ON010_g784 [Phytophthora cinnamomi]
MIPLGSIFPSLFSSWVFGNFVNDGNRSFELRFSVVEIEPQDDSVQVEGLTGINLPCNAMESTTSTFFNQYASWSTGAIPRGLINLGNTCFMNAVIQCLATTPLLQAYIIGTEHRQEFISLHSPAASRKTTTQPASNSLICTLRELFVGMHPRGQGIANDERSLSPAKVLGALSTHSPHMFDGTQQDAQEFLVCLLGFLGDTLKRRPTHTQNGESHILSPRSHTVLTNLFKPKDDKSTTDKLSSQLCVGDSNGRHDRVVATEWWVSHIVHEPSVTNILFSGQFKSALICTRCTHQSARFEPFSSLQLPLIEDNTNFQASNEGQRYLVVIIHFAESSRNSVGARGPVRAVVQINDHSTVGDVITRLTTFRSKPGSCEYIVGRFEEYTIQNLLVSDRTEDQIEDQTPASALPSPMHAFEAFNITGSGDDTVTPTSESTKVYVRFVHRQSFLVPFYCTTPTRQALCGSPFVCSSICGALTGQALHQMVLRRFLCGHNSRSKPRSSNTNSFKRQTEGSAHHYAPTFSLRRVRDDGIACSRCHWGTGCRGCLIPPTATAAELLDLENCATISIDWDTQLHPQYPSAFWWLQSYPTRDHSSYIHYLRTKTHPLTKSLQSLCSTEHLDASCSQCQQSTPHTKQLSLWSLPPVLVLQLKRFELCTTNGNYQWRKLCHDVDFPVRGLDLRDLLSPIDGGHDDSEPCTDRCFVDALDPRVRLGIEYLQNELNIPLSSASRSCTKYDLYAVVNHCGRGISSGHYTAHIRRPDESRWWLADDTVVTPLREDELSPSATAYLLFYVRQDIASGATELSDLFPTESD